MSKPTTTAKDWTEPDDAAAPWRTTKTHEGEVLEGAEWPAKTRRSSKYECHRGRDQSQARRIQDDRLQETADGYEKGRKAIALCVKTRSGIEEKRVELKAPSLKFYGRTSSTPRRPNSLA